MIISTDSLAFVLNLPNSDGDGRDESLINGYITFVGRLGTDIESIGSELPTDENRITQNRFANNIFRISIPDSINDPGENGIHEIVDNFYDKDDHDVRFEITITDVAGNQISWTDVKKVRIDLTPPSISLISSTSSEGWYNINDTINIRIR